MTWIVERVGGVGVGHERQVGPARAHRRHELHVAAGPNLHLDPLVALADEALDLGSCRVINIKVSRLGGLGEARRVHDLCASRDIPVWCGGMHEFGIGRAANVALCSLPGFTLPGDVSGSDKYYAEDVVDPPILATNGAIPVPDKPGLGWEPNEARIKKFTVRELTLTTEGVPA